MPFTDPAVAAVFAEYADRAISDRQRMRDLGEQGYERRDEFLLPVGEDVGLLLHSLILAQRPHRILELGTSYGYSTLFLADAARAVGATVVSIDLADYKQHYAGERLTTAGLAAHVEFRCGDAVDLIAADEGEFDFVLLDVWKTLYVPCFEALHPKLADEAILVADNMISPESARASVREYRAAVRAKGDMQQVLLTAGQGIDLAVKWSADNPKL